MRGIGRLEVVGGVGIFGVVGRGARGAGDGGLVVVLVLVGGSVLVVGSRSQAIHSLNRFLFALGRFLLRFLSVSCLASSRSVRSKVLSAVLFSTSFLWMCSDIMRR